MQGLIQDLLAYSRAGTNGKVLREISSEDALKEALTNLRATIEESGAVVTHDSLPAITTDETQLAQVFQNLVGNAIKYRGAEVPHVHVSATKNGGNEWIFSVRDNGLGIDPQYFERIFILFQRLHGRDEFEGTGIGLAICKKIVERLGGRIWVESQPGKGLNLLLCPAGKRWEMMESIGTDAAPIEVLLVEDSPGDVRLTREAFKDAKVHINLHVASDGAEAMAFLGREGRARQCSSPGSDLARSEPAQERRPGGSGGNQGESDAEEHSCRYLDYLCV